MLFQRMKPLSIVICTLCALIVAAVAFAVSGLYNVSARVLHLTPTALLLEAARDRSIAHYSSKIELPAQLDPMAAMVGAVGIALNTRSAYRKEIFWVIDNGLKMTGMPAFGVNHEPEEIIGMTAFIKKLPELDEQSYTQFVEQALANGLGEDHHHGESAPEVHPDEPHGHSHEDYGHHD